MKSQNEFMKQMLELVDFAKAKDGTITKKEVADYCSDLELADGHLKLVYDFLDEHGIQVVGHKAKKSKTNEADSPDGFTTAEGDGLNLNTEDSRYLSVYRRELNGLAEYSREEKEALYEKLRAGDESVMHAVIESCLKRATTLAGKYKNRGVPLEDLIQEANLTLITTVDMICGNSDISDVKKELEQSIKGRLIELVDAQTESRGLEHTIVAKTNLIHEATKVLAEDLGRLATAEELAEYTKMTEDEIRMYVELSLEEIQIGKGEGSR